MSLRDIFKNSRSYLTQKARDAVNWYRNAITGIFRRPGEVQGPPKPPGVGYNRVAAPELGKLYLYYYDPKWKHVLPFYDQYPLTFPITYYPDGFLGINLHYLPPLLRVTVLSALEDLGTYDNRTAVQRRELLEAFALRFNGFEGCVKRYLYNHVRSSFFEIPQTDWENVAVLPLQKWVINRNASRRGRPPY